MASQHFQVFLSHANRDKPFVRQVAIRLRREGVSFFLDESHLIPGQPWQDALEQALSTSDSCAVFVGDEGLAPYHRIEMRVAASRQIEGEGGFRVIPVLLPGTTQPAERDLPAFLRQLTWVRFTAPPDHDELTWRLASGKCTPEQMGLPPNTVPVFTRFRDLRRESLEGDGRLAWWLHQEQNRTAAPLDELAAEARQALSQIQPDSGLGVDGRKFLERMRDEAGILA